MGRMRNPVCMFCGKVIYRAKNKTTSKCFDCVVIYEKFRHMLRRINSD
jgi:hypothetical protein